MTKSEAQTRSELIDQHLVQSGWNIKDPPRSSKNSTFRPPCPKVWPTQNLFSLNKLRVNLGGKFDG